MDVITRDNLEHVARWAAKGLPGSRTDARQDCAVELLEHRMGKPVGSAVGYTRAEVRRRRARTWGRDPLRRSIASGDDFEPLDLAPGVEDPGPRRVEEMELVGRALAHLPRHQRRALLLRGMGLTLKAAAEVEGISEDAMGWRVRRGIEAMQRLIEQADLPAVDMPVERFNVA